MFSRAGRQRILVSGLRLRSHVCYRSISTTTTRLEGRTPTHPDPHDQRRTLEQHLAFAKIVHGEKVASRQMRKFGIKFAGLHPDRDRVKRAFIEAESMAEWSAVIDRFYPARETDVIGTG